MAYGTGQRLLKEIREQLERERAEQQRRDRWREENERIRGRHVTPKSERPKCGARCRDGHQCQAPVVWDAEWDEPWNGRCRMHGGLSTGPTTEDGKRRALEAARRGGRRSVEKRREDGGTAAVPRLPREPYGWPLPSEERAELFRLLRS